MVRRFIFVNDVISMMQGRSYYGLRIVVGELILRNSLGPKYFKSILIEFYEEPDTTRANGTIVGSMNLQNLTASASEKSF
jgi:hypothetical protein